eukprot:jgi/Mesen1/8560/ME000049S07954
MPSLRQSAAMASILALVLLAGCALSAGVRVEELSVSLGAETLCGVEVRTPNTPFYDGVLAEPHKATPFEISWACSDGKSNNFLAIRSKAPTGYAAFGFSPKLIYKKLGISEIVVEVCDTKKAVADLSNASNDDWCKGDTGLVGTYTIPVLVMYVRREIRSKSPEDRFRYFSAIHTIAKVPTAEGKLKYGPRFVNYYEINAKHAAAALAAPCDLAHGDAAFFTYHRALTREFEQSLQAVDPTVSLAYWDMYQEGAMEDPSKSVIFSDEFYGNLSGDPNDKWIVKNGQFAYWRIPHGEEAHKLESMSWGGVGPSNWTNAYGFNRRPDNMNRAAYVSRVGVLGDHETPFATLEGWQKCVKLDSYNEYRVCLDYIRGAHTAGHIRIGGTWGLPSIKDIKDKVDCAGINLDDKTCTEVLKDVQLLVAVSHGIGYAMGCLKCEKKCASVEQDPSECACEWQSQQANCSASAMVKFTMESTIIFEKPFPKLTPEEVDHVFKFANALWGNPNTFMGEYQDTATSATDPIFWAQHCNIDRAFASWRRAHLDGPWEDMGFNKPVGLNVNVHPYVPCAGHDLHDSLARGSFYALYRSQAGIKEALTNLDMCKSVDVELTDVANSDYIYDYYME